MLPAALLTAGAVGWLLVAERASSSARSIAKPLASAGFLAVAIAAGALDTSFGRWMLAALVLSTIGDVFLLGKSELAFLAGLGSFLAAHLLFVVAFTVRGIAPAGLVSIVPLKLFAWWVLRWLGPHLSDRMRSPVTAYALVISLMGVVAIATVADAWDARIPVGAALFIVSDLAVARDNFVTPGFQNRLVGLPLY
ncbi:MAG: lysoplasmalogenase family protein, partial [Acidimicrobiia bacterium]